jgi:hypothetical protein
MTRPQSLLLVATALVALSACSKPSTDAGSPPPPAPAVSKTADSGGNAASKAATFAQLAYDYSYGFSGPAEGTDALLKADQAACDQAGPTQCQTIALTSRANQDQGFGEQILELRVAPAWLKAWQGGLDARLAQTHEKLHDRNVASEDLSLQVVDTQSHLKNMEALRDRMQEIIRTGHGKLDELMDVENRLSQVQADIDSTQSSLAVMQARLTTVHMVLTYRSETGPGAESAFAPVARAARSSFGLSMRVVALLVTVAGIAIPLGFVTLPIVWWARRAARKDRAANQAPTA